MANKIKLDPNSTEERYGFKCPGCKDYHRVRVAGKDPWGWNGSLDRPTFAPSILVRFPQGKDNPDLVCHSFVTDGRIQFLGDCFHELKNQTVDLADI